MDSELQKHLDFFSAPQHLSLFADICRGLERETLRVETTGELSTSKHPATLGSALCHPWFTTDFSEALLELVTPKFCSLNQTLFNLEQLHILAAKVLSANRELLWAASMPGLLEQDEMLIPIAYYGESNSGRIKTLYRKGLANRYGRKMQMIAGIHYNFSLPGAFWELWKAENHCSTQQKANRGYMHIMRNCQRHAWLLVYLFGASPVVHGSYLHEREHKLDDLGYGDYGLANATSLRLSPAGYRSENQQQLNISLNSLEEYIDNLLAAIHQPCAEYREKGLIRNNQHLQMNTNVLQIENEYYGLIRPKRTLEKGKPLLKLLADDGIEYVELRLLDLDPNCAFGIDKNTLCFIDAFLLHCLLSSSPLMDEREQESIQSNLDNTILNGRDRTLCLNDGGKSRALHDWAGSILQQIDKVAELLDQGTGGNEYAAACRQQFAKLADPSLLPSARILQDLAQKNCSSAELMLERSRQFTHNLQQMSLDKTLEQQHEQLQLESFQAQLKMERQDSAEISFAEYLKHYYDGYARIRNTVPE